MQKSALSEVLQLQACTLLCTWSARLAGSRPRMPNAGPPAGATSPFEVP